MIWIDMDPLLEKERERCELASQDLKEAQDKLDRFKNEVTPAFSIWFHSHFGEALTEVRTLHDKMTELENSISWVREESERSGISERAAYELLLKLRSGIEEPRLDDQEQEDEEEIKGEQSEDGLPSNFEELLRTAFEELVGPASQFSPKEYNDLLESYREHFTKEFNEELLNRAESHNQNDRGRSDRKSRSSPQNSRSAPDETKDEEKIKRLYRDLARKLHPDHNSSLSSKETELWYEVQAAYDSQDLSRLETLAALTEDGNQIGFFKIRSISSLRAILNDFQDRLFSTEKALREAKKNPAWDFLAIQRNPDRLNQLKRSIDRDLRDDTESLGEEVEGLEEIIARWERSKKPRRTARSKAKGMTKAEMDKFTGFGSPKAK
jgi:DnaJ domain